MSSSKLLFGFFFLTAGLLIFANNFIPIHGLQEVWRLWPLILIFLGISSLISQNTIKQIIMVCIGILAGMVLFSMISVNDEFITTSHYGLFSSQSDSISIPFDSTLSDTTYLSIGAGITNIVLLGSDDSSLIKTKSEAEVSNDEELDFSLNPSIHIEKKVTDGNHHINVDINANTDLFESPRLHKATFYLSKKAVWYLSFNGGVSSYKADLSSLKMASVVVSVGVSDFQMKLGSLLDSSHVDIEGAAAKYALEIPEGVGCRIQHESALTKHDFPGFIQKDDLSYESPNYDKSQKKITIRLHTGVSAISVKKYKQNPPDNPLPSSDSMASPLPQKLDIKPNKFSRQL